MGGDFGGAEGGREPALGEKGGRVGEVLGGELQCVGGDGDVCLCVNRVGGGLVNEEEKVLGEDGGGDDGGGKRRLNQSQQEKQGS